MGEMAGSVGCIGIAVVIAIVVLVVAMGMRDALKRDDLSGWW